MQWKTLEQWEWVSRTSMYVMDWIVLHKIPTFKLQHLVSQSVTVFEYRVFKEEIKLKWDH